MGKYPEAAVCVMRSIALEVESHILRLDGERIKLELAEKFDLRFEEVKGSNSLIYRTLFGPWDDDFVIAEPGQTIKYVDFKTEATTASNFNMYGMTPPRRSDNDG